ncbi:MAG: GntR family transcriptional regulator [Planctomycetaceae bacterium]|nr:GntR family transcriptional regulator [Planctomycetaceae bacterium]
MLVRQPIYQQLNEALRSLLGSGEFRTGAQFLTERQVSQRFEVSRATANKALSNLVSEGVLEFKKGIGTFVRGGVLDYDLRSLVSFTGKASGAGKKPTTRVLNFDRRTGATIARSVAAALKVRDEDGVYVVERLRLADGSPVILERRHIVEAHCPGLKREELAGSLYALWTERYRLEIAGAEQTIRAAALPRDDAKHLGVAAGAAALEVRSLGVLREARPLWWERTLYRGDAYAFRNRLGPIQTARPASGEFLGPDADEEENRTL